MRLFITATDTGVGKTIVSALLFRYLLSRSLDCVYLKPLQTGCSHALDRESDAAVVYGKGARKEIEDAICYLFSPARAPYFAASLEGREIDWGHLLRWVEERTRGRDVAIIEGAGGLMVPVTRHRLIIDLIKETSSHAIVVARPGLGTINHTLLSLEMLTKRDIPIKGVWFSLGEETPRDLMEENRRAIEMFSGIGVEVVEHLEDLSSPSLQFPSFFSHLF